MPDKAEVRAPPRREAVRKGHNRKQLDRNFNLPLFFVGIIVLFTSIIT